jgi:hypothetical protein
VINPQATYRVAVNDYMAAGGSGFLVLKRNTAKVNTGISLRDALIDYMQRMDDPLFEGPYRKVAVTSSDGNEVTTKTVARGAIRCNDPRWATDNDLKKYRTVDSTVAARYCPGKQYVDECFGPVICVLPHNQETDGRITPRLE